MAASSTAVLYAGCKVRERMLRTPAVWPGIGEVWGMRGLIGLIVIVVVVYLVLRFLNII